MAIMKVYGGAALKPVNEVDSGVIIGIYGPGGCLDENTHIPYVVFADGERRNHKGGTIKHLYERFHRSHVSGRGYYQRESTIDSTFMLASTNEDGEIFYNRVVNVVETGIQECYEIVTYDDRTIVATANHKFFTGESYIQLEDLREESRLSIHNNTMYRSIRRSIPPTRKELYVKQHPYARVKLVVNWNAYLYAVLPRSRATVEAQMNGMSLDEYIGRLNGEASDLIGLQFLSPDVEIHHKDENTLNDDLTNLEMLSKEEHARTHTPLGKAVARYVTTTDTIKSIRRVGKRHTYDIAMESPYNNYIANKFVVHNCGKTTCAATATDSEYGSPALLLDARGNPHVIRSYNERIQVATLKNFKHQEDIRQDLIRDTSREFKTVIIDNLSEILAINLRDRYGAATEIKWQMQSGSTADMLGLVRNWSDLATPPYNMNVIFVLWDTPEQRTIKGQDVSRSEIMANKALQSQIPGLITWLGRLYIVSDSPPYTRCLDFRPIESMHQAKFQVDPNDPKTRDIPMEIYNPSLASIIDCVRGGKEWPQDKHKKPSLKDLRQANANANATSG